MEKEQPDSLATVAVVSEKMPQTHSHYAPSEVYSSAEPPPAYMKPSTRNTAVQITRIIAIALITMSVVLGSFSLAASWVKARATCTPESIAAMQAELKLQQQQQQTAASYQQSEFLKHLQPEALIQDTLDMKESPQTLTGQAPKKEVESDTAEVKVQKEEENNSKSDNENGDRDEDEDDYDDDEFPPVHIKLPLQFDFDEIAGSLIQEARSRVSCVVERRRADQVMDGMNNNNLDNSTDAQRFQRLSGERVAILCESGNPHQEQQEQQEVITPLIIPLGTVQVPLQSQEPNPNYHQYQVHTQYQVPDMQQLPLSDPRGLNHIPPGVLPPELRNMPQVTLEMRPPRMGPNSPMMGSQNPAMGPQIELRRIPIEVRHFPVESVRGMRPPMPQEPRQEPQQIPLIFQQAEQMPSAYGQEQQVPMMPPLPPQGESQVHERVVSQRMIPQVHEQRAVHPMMIPQTEQRPPQPQPQPQPQPSPERPHFPFQGIPFEIRRIIQQVPLEIKNIIQHITGEARAIPVPVPEGARRENVQEFKPFPEGAQPIPLGPFPLPIEVKNLLEHGNIEGRPRGEQSNEQQEDETADERNFAVPAEIRNIIHQVVEGNAIPVPRFTLPLRPVESLEIPVQAHAEVTDAQTDEREPEQRQQEQQEQHQQAHMMMQQQQQQQQPQPQQPQIEQEEESRPHYVQPRSVRSIPEAFTHRREKRVRRCACDCAC